MEYVCQETDLKVHELMIVFILKADS
uniref:Uncharacterized protein n=1 Tax=Nymphaea colorata TaxID=210225 RepID=A0A5K0ZGN9_9MAGN